MERKTIGIIATVLTALFCGCPGLFVCLSGAITAAGLGEYTSQFGDIPYAGQLGVGTGIALLCLGVVLVAIPILVGIFTLRNKGEAGDVEAV